MLKMPIDAILDDLTNVLEAKTNVVLIAAPGAGKTTRVPLALSNQNWCSGKKIVMLEPRRLAARSAACYMAKILGEKIGETVGYRVRHDSMVSDRTLIEVVTEGVLTRMLQDDPSLEKVGAVIFDEFHERSLNADLGLALCLEVQSVLRSDLRLIVMSATLEAEPVAKLLGNAPVIVSHGQEFPVETRYLDRPVDGRIEQTLIKTILKALEQDSGDVLVFLPGAGEIHRLEHQLQELNLPGIIIAPLYGNLPQKQQDLAISRGKDGRRKIVLATSIAETSLTVEGIGIVIDSGLTRVPRFSPRTGMTRLETIQVSRASADQRRGRAGRLGPGVCYRLWTESDDLKLTETRQPEILQVDLAPLALELATWGTNDPYNFAWLTPPPKAAIEQAYKLLYELEAVDEDKKITSHGRQIASAGIHPRLAHMIIKGHSLGLGSLACELAALLGERDIMKGTENVDIRLRIAMLRSNTVDSVIQSKLAAEIAYLQRQFKIVPQQAEDIEACGLLLAMAYPDRIAQKRANGKFLLSNGRGAYLPAMQTLSDSAFLVAAELDDHGSDSRIFLAAPLAIEDLTANFQDQIQVTNTIVWDSASQAVRARKQYKLGALMLKEEQLRDPESEAVIAALLAGIRQEGLDILPWTKAARRFQQRIIFMRCHQMGYPDMSDEGLMASLEEWLVPYLYGITSRAQLQQINLLEIFESMLTYEQRQQLEEFAPAHITAPSGQRLSIDYSNPGAPVLAVRLQEMFGQKETPRIARGRVNLTLHLLSPAQRPVQVTQDLANFWANTYFEVRKDLAGRYPKHYWPDNPLAAVPTHRVKPRDSN